MTFTEMIRAKSVTAGYDVTSMMDTIDDSTPTGLQLVAADERELKECLSCIASSIKSGKKKHWQNISVIDLNFGCPKPEIVKPGLGPCMLSRPAELRPLFECLRSFKESGALPSLRAVGAKIRLGLTHDEHHVQKVYLPVFSLASEYLDYLTVHPRNASSSVRSQSPDFPALSSLCSSLPRGVRSLKVLGNADVVSVPSLARLLGTGVDGAVIGRGAIDNPWIFRHLLGKGDPWPTLAEVDEEEERAKEWEGRWIVHNGSIKNKYVTFREINFERIRHMVKTGENIVVGNKQVREMKREHLRIKGEAEDDYEARRES